MEFKKRALELMFKGGKVRRGAKLKSRKDILMEIGLFHDKKKRLTELYDELVEDGYIYLDICYCSNVSPLEYRKKFGELK